ncbi:MAG: isoleucine--tRNA ligase [Candidatus Marsarchaeota archaeon]|nr:isoleucine--tRNA ligase [Candidatus Marsarchaeota archaeon]
MLNLNEKEVKIIEYWKKNDINNKVRQKLKGNKKFYFLDGPPFITGNPHPGAVWVKSIKDMYLRYKRYKGYNVYDRAGYDVHGLPIENKVEALLQVKSKKDIEATIGIEEFINKCKEFVQSYKGSTDKDYERFGISLDLSNPYLPSNMDYMDVEWNIFKKIFDNGYVYEGRKTMPFCPHCQTAVSQGSSEIVYSNSNDPSIYLKFKVVKSGKMALDNNTYLIIWTTTPWTIVSNVAIAVNPEERYVLAFSNDENYIIAKARFDKVVAAIDKSLIVKAEFYGSELADIYYVSPLEEKVPEQKEMRRYHKVILSKEFVTMDDGTGLVHIAPGHGPEDYKLGIANKLPIFSPIGADGAYDEHAGAYKGLKVPDDANKNVLNDLEMLNTVLAKGNITHSYPHCWRCNNKIIFIATEQWFFNVQKIKRKLMNELHKIKFYPKEAEERLSTVIQTSPDWCVSRQRYWGVPLPIWKCSNSKCRHYNIIGSFSELKGRSKNKAYTESIKDLHRNYVDKAVISCEKCGSDAFRIQDIFDVWFDSSIAFRASMNEDQFNESFPIDLILEGTDQFRGWYSSLLKSAVFAYKKAPYKNLCINGFMLDEHGKEMHKSLGNYEPVEDIYSTYGADAFRLWTSGHTPPWADLLFSKSELNDAVKAVSIIYNISNLIKEYSEMFDYKPAHNKRISAKNLDISDQYILSKSESLLQYIDEKMSNYELYKAVAALKEFLIEDYSRFYLKIVKKHILYGSKADARRILNILSYVTYRMLISLSIVAPFVSESVYLELFNSKESIFLEDWPKVNKKFINKELEDEIKIIKDAISALLNAREKSNIPLRWPVANETIEVKSQSAYNTTEKFSLMIEELTNAKHLIIKQSTGIKAEIKPMFAKIGPEFKERAKVVADALVASDPEVLREAMNRGGVYDMHTEKGTVRITPEHFIIVSKVEKPDAVLFKEGMAYVSKELSAELKEEALIREFERRIQLMRKSLMLKKKDYIILKYSAVKELSDLIEKNKRTIIKTINAKKILGIKHEESSEALKEFEIDGLPVKVIIEVYQQIHQ